MPKSALLSLPVVLLLAPAARADEAPTFARDVAPIAQRRCQTCHVEGGVGPFPLLTRDDFAEHAPMIEEVLSTRRMPPWHADDTGLVFDSWRAMPDGERSTLLSWLKGDMPAGDPAQAPPALPARAEWAIGTPDVVLPIPAYDVPATGTVGYRYVDVPTNFGEDRWIKAVEVKVGARSVVHHILVFVRYPKAAGPSPDFRGGLEGYFASALPGEDLRPYPAGTARRLPAGTTLKVQLHYTPDGTARRDESKIGIIFAKPDEQITRESKTVALYSTRFRIPPGVKGHEVRARYEFGKDTILFGLTPHMHVRGESFRYLLMLPDGTNRPLLAVPRWDFEWQTTYRLAQPLFIPRGSKVVGLATYDNSAENRANPDPNATVYFGEQTRDEMMIGYMDVLEATPEERAAWEASQAPAAR